MKDFNGLYREVEGDWEFLVQGEWVPEYLLDFILTTMEGK